MSKLTIEQRARLAEARIRQEQTNKRIDAIAEDSRSLQKSSLILCCGTHGSVPWAGEVICLRCNSVWNLGTDAHVPPPECGKNCTCGAPLSGENGAARAICAVCYSERRLPH